MGISENRRFYIGTSLRYGFCAAKIERGWNLDNKCSYCVNTAKAPDLPGLHVGFFLHVVFKMCVTLFCRSVFVCHTCVRTKLAQREHMYFE